MWNEPRMNVAVQSFVLSVYSEAVIFHAEISIQAPNNTFFFRLRAELSVLVSREKSPKPFHNGIISPHLAYVCDCINYLSDRSVEVSILSGLTSQSGAESVVITIQQPVQDACEDSDVVI